MLIMRIELWIMNKKVILLLIILGIIAGFLIYAINNVDEDEYMTGKETQDSFCNGRYQILRCFDDYSLNDEKEIFAIEEYVYRYKESGGCIYVEGKSGYSVIECDTGNVIKEEHLEDLDDKYQKAFHNVFTFEDPHSNDMLVDYLVRLVVFSWILIRIIVYFRNRRCCL